MLNEILQQNYFQLFRLQPTFSLDRGYLQQRLRELQQQFHPDNYAAAAPELQQQSVVVSGHINQAYTTLSQPLSRAIYLFKLQDIPFDLVYATQFTPEFLMQQIELREQIAEASQDVAQLEQIERSLQQSSQQLVAQISDLFKLNQPRASIELVKQLAFYNKLEQVVTKALDQL